jgi:hypothetical protein
VNGPKYPDFTEEDFAAFIEYATTMLCVQQFELALKQLATHYVQTPEDATFEKALKDVQKLLTTAVGPLTDHLAKHGKVTEVLLEELRKAAKLRNHLAHEYMLNYVLNKNLGSVDPDEEIARLDTWSEDYCELDAELSALSREVLRERGMDPNEVLDKKEMLDILRKQRAKDEDSEAESPSTAVSPLAPDPRPATEGAREGSEPRSWWRRWFGFE